MPAARHLRGTMLTPSLKLRDGNTQTNPVLIYRFTFFAFCFFSSYLLIAQGVNLVPNGSFEDRDLCIYNDSYVEDAYPWFNPQSTETFLPGTSDLFNICGNVNEDPCPYPDNAILDPWFFGIPTNTLGCQMPKEGDGYAGAFFYYPNPDLEEGFREYLAVPFSESLMAGSVYELSFSVSLSERSSLALWNVQAIISLDSLLQPEYGGYIDYPAQFHGTPEVYLNDKNIWYDFQWTYVAEGGERFLYIGNFQPNSETDTLRVQEVNTLGHYPGTYYYVDDVKLIQSVLSARNVTPDWLKIYPNPVTDMLHVDIDQDENLSVSIFDLSGRFLYSLTGIKGRRLNIDLSRFDPGLYLVQITQENGKSNYVEKIVKQ